MNGPLQTVVFDLDGVVLESEPAIRASLDLALDAIGEPPIGDAEIRSLIGPPLSDGVDSLLESRGGPRQLVARVVDEYRAHYALACVQECRMFPGVAETIWELTTRGVVLAVATSKPAQFSVPILEELGISRFLTAIVAPGTSVSETKTETLGRALAELGNPSRETTAMVGDRGVDMEAAVFHGLIPVGALWGYGDRIELVGSGAQVLVGEPHELLGMVDSGW